MMMIPKKRNDFNLLEDMFEIDPFFSRESSKVMQTDIEEKHDKYLITIDLPGYEKENIRIDIEDGYLNVHAKVDSRNDEEEKGKFVRKERYFGECSRSFYVGDDITETDVKASFKNGILRLEIPKKEEKKAIPEKKYIEIGD